MNCYARRLRRIFLQPLNIALMTGTLLTGCGGAVTTSPGEVPIANAGPDLSLGNGEVVHLDGSASRTHDGQTEGLAYHWRQLAGTPVTFIEEQGEMLATPSFITPAPSAPETLTFELTVSADGYLAKDRVQIQVTPCAGEDGEVFNDCVVRGFGPIASFQWDSTSLSGYSQYEGKGSHHVHWETVQSEDPERGRVLEVTWNPLNTGSTDINGWFGIHAFADSLNLERFDTGSLSFDMRVVYAEENPLPLLAKLECGWPCTSEEFPVHNTPQDYEWHSYTFSVADIASSGLDLTQVGTPFIIFPVWNHQTTTAVVQLDNIRFTEEFTAPEPDALPPAPSEQQEHWIYPQGSVEVNYSAFANGAAEGTFNITEISGEGEQPTLELQYMNDGSGFTFYFVHTLAQDLTGLHHGEILFDMRVVSYGGNSGEFLVNAFCGPACSAFPQYSLGRPLEGEWHAVRVPVRDLAARGVDLSRVTTPFVLNFSERDQAGMTVQLRDIRWQYLPE